MYKIVYMSSKFDVYMSSKFWRAIVHNVHYFLKPSIYFKLINMRNIFVLQK